MRLITSICQSGNYNIFYVSLYLNCNYYTVSYTVRRKQSMSKTHGQASVIVEEAKVIPFIYQSNVPITHAWGQKDCGGIKRPGVPMTKNPEHKQQRSYSYTGSRSRSRNPGRVNMLRS